MIETQLQTIHKLTDYKVVYICPDHNEKYHKRKLYMETLLSSLGFKDIVHFKSGNESYPKCLAVATQEILTKYIDVPFLLIEDDVGFIDKLEFTIPLYADAIYFGLSLCASHPTESYNVYYAEFEQFSCDQVKVKNMLGTHAIMYLTRKYKEQVIQIMQRCIDQSGYNDMAISRIQRLFNVYANKIPTFYQSNAFNTVINGFDVEKATKVQIKDDLMFERML